MIKKIEQVTDSNGKTASSPRYRYILIVFSEILEDAYWAAALEGITKQISVTKGFLPVFVNLNHLPSEPTTDERGPKFLPTKKEYFAHLA